MKWKSLRMKDTMSMSAWYSTAIYQKTKRDQNRIVGFGECNWRTGGHVGIRAHERRSQLRTRIENGNENETGSGIWSGTLSGKRMGSGSWLWQVRGSVIWTWTLI